MFNKGPIGFDLFYVEFGCGDVFKHALLVGLMLRISRYNYNLNYLFRIKHTYVTISRGVVVVKGRVQSIRRYCRYTRHVRS